MLRTQSGSFNNHNPEYRCVICTGVTLFALVLQLNCTALSQSESSNFFMYIIIFVTACHIIISDDFKRRARLLAAEVGA